MKPVEFFKTINESVLVEAIKAAEARTSAELRLFVTRHKSTDPFVDARKQFQHLLMNRTRDRNGVLLFIAPESQNFAVVGDEGIHKHCGDDFWKQTAAEIEEQFKKGAFQEGLVLGIGKLGALLAQHFPRESDDRNELSDEIAKD